MATRAHYASSISRFLAEPEPSVLGKLVEKSAHNVELAQRNAWIDEITILKEQLAGFTEGHVFLEFSMPRMGKRADAVVIVRNVIFVIEFKVGATEFLAADRAQAIDYALDLRNFHEGSHKAKLVPVLIATEASPRSRFAGDLGNSSLQCLEINDRGLHDVIANLSGTSRDREDVINVEAWLNSGYKPTPTIVEAAQALYRDHDVSEISRSDAGVKNLTETTNAIAEIIAAAKSRGEKAICFVTGVPGAGKTLAGLSVTTSQMNHADDEHAVFLSGNGPLVKVLRTALARDYKERNQVTMEEAKRQTHAFIQNIHHFRDDSLESTKPPADRVVVFDEAQRAWDNHHTVKFMRQKKGRRDFDASEPEFLIEVLDRHDDWCVIVALIGGGQEINSGEAGLSEWFLALQKRFSNWKVYHSSQMSSDEYAGDLNFDSLVEGLDSNPRESLHLGVSVRSFRAGRLSEFVHHLIGNNPEQAAACYSEIQERYPVCLTRDINQARAWLRDRAQGSELFGLIASSGARRLKPDGLDIKSQIEPDLWFLNGPEDVRACQYLEQVATEFDIQGLELDWAGVCWDADLRRSGDNWDFRKFSGTKWQMVNKKINQQYLLNAYRVLLTRARQGMVIYVPGGEPIDRTRPPEFYEPIVEYLQSAGIPLLV